MTQTPVLRQNLVILRPPLTATQVNWGVYASPQKGATLGRDAHEKTDTDTHLWVWNNRTEIVTVEFEPYEIAIFYRLRVT